MVKKVALIHTGFALVDVLKNLFDEIIPDIEMVNILDDSLLREVLKEGKVTKPVIERMISYFKSAEYYKVDAILNVCSSVGEVVDIARMIINTPIIKIDEKMAESAVEKATNIGVAATLQSTLDPTCRLLEKKANENGKKIVLTRTLCPGAFEELMNGNSKKHDEIVLDAINKLSGQVEIVVLAQGSMARLADSLNRELSSRVFSSSRSGVLEVKRILEAKKI
jgi:Asp/Glu/hydantoin racemase